MPIASMFLAVSMNVSPFVRLLLPRPGNRRYPHQTSGGQRKTGAGAGGRLEEQVRTVRPANDERRLRQPPVASLKDTAVSSTSDNSSAERSSIPNRWRRVQAAGVVLISPTLVLMSSSRGASARASCRGEHCGQILSPESVPASKGLRVRRFRPLLVCRMSEKSPIIILLAIADPASAARLRGASGPMFRLVPATEQAEAGEIRPRTLADVIVVVDGEPLALDRPYRRRIAGVRRRIVHRERVRAAWRRHRFLFRRMPRIAS